MWRKRVPAGGAFVVYQVLGKPGEGKYDFSRRAHESYSSIANP